MDEWLHPTKYNGCAYLRMPLNSVSKRGPRYYFTFRLVHIFHSKKASPHSSIQSFLYIYIPSISAINIVLNTQTSQQIKARFTNSLTIINKKAQNYVFIKSKSCYQVGTLSACHYEPEQRLEMAQCCLQWDDSLIARFMGPTWGPSGADRTQVGPMLAPWALQSGL